MSIEGQSNSGLRGLYRTMSQQAGFGVVSEADGSRDGNGRMMVGVDPSVSQTDQPDQDELGSIQLRVEGGLSA